jgi:hypothetical protein
LEQELDAADAQNENAYDGGSQLVWKKKRAALEAKSLQVKGKGLVLTETSCKGTSEQLTEAPVNEPRITSDKLMGALALMELSGITPSSEVVSPPDSEQFLEILDISLEGEEVVLPYVTLPQGFEDLASSEY